MSSLRMLTASTVFVSFHFACHYATAATLNFQEGVSPTAGYVHGATYVFNGLGGGNANDNANGSGSQSLIVSSGDTSFFDDAHSLFEFDLTAIETAISGPVQIDSISLVLFNRGTNNGFTGSGNSITVGLSTLSEDFDETTVTWNSLTPDGGDITGTLLSSLTFDPTPGANGVDVTFASTTAFENAALNALAAPGNTLRFVAHQTSVGNTYARFYYDETHANFAADLKPELIIEFSALPVPEPATGWLLILGVVGLSTRRRSRYGRRCITT